MDPGERIQLLKSHITRFGETREGKKNYAILKRFFKIYVHSFENATSRQARLMRTNNCLEGLQLIREFEDAKILIPQ